MRVRVKVIIMVRVGGLAFGAEVWRPSQQAPELR